jgi:hypothetical protein
MHKVEYVGRDGNQVRTPLETPITFEGFECYLADQEIISDLGQYSANRDEAYTAYVPNITRIRGNCFVHNFKCAAVGLFNPNLIARKLGLTEKQDIEVKGQISPFTPIDLDVQEDNGTS